MKNFIRGFEKKAYATGWGMTLGAGVGNYLAQKKNIKTLEGWRNDNKSKKDAKQIFKSLDTKGIHLMTEADLNKEIKKEKDLGHATVLQSIRDSLEHSNAAALHPEMIPGFAMKHIPKALKDKKIVFSADRVDPSALAHEVGHILDFDELSKKPFLSKFMNKYLRSKISVEEAAWKKAPGKINEKTKEEALSSYRRARNYPLVGMLVGGALGAAVDYAVIKGAYR